MQNSSGNAPVASRICILVRKQSHVSSLNLTLECRDVTDSPTQNSLSFLSNDHLTRMSRIGQQTSPRRLSKSRVERGAEAFRPPRLLPTCSTLFCIFFLSCYKILLYKNCSITFIAARSKSTFRVNSKNVNVFLFYIHNLHFSTWNALSRGLLCF